jgi:hypothetical protein
MSEQYFTNEIINRLHEISENAEIEIKSCLKPGIDLSLPENNELCILITQTICVRLIKKLESIYNVAEQQR